MAFPGYLQLYFNTDLMPIVIERESLHHMTRVSLMTYRRTTVLIHILTECRNAPAIKKEWLLHLFRSVYHYLERCFRLEFHFDENKLL